MLLAAPRGGSMATGPQLVPYVQYCMCTHYMYVLYCIYCICNHLGWPKGPAAVVTAPPGCDHRPSLSICILYVSHLGCPEGPEAVVSAPPGCGHSQVFFVFIYTILYILYMYHLGCPGGPAAVVAVLPSPRASVQASSLK